MVIGDILRVGDSLLMQTLSVKCQCHLSGSDGSAMTWGFGASSSWIVAQSEQFLL